MKTLFKVCLTLFLFNYSFQIQAQDPSPFTVPYELAIVGFDTEISASGDDQFILLNAIEISSGYKFGITNLNYDNANDLNEWKTSFSQVAMGYQLEYTGSQPLPIGSYIYLKTALNTQSPVKIEIDRTDRSQDFTITQLTIGHQNEGFLTSSGGFFNIYTGYMVPQSGTYKLLGTVIDGIATGKTAAQMVDKIPKELTSKDYTLTDLGGSLYGDIRGDDNCICRLLELLLLQLNWEIKSGDIRDNSAPDNTDYGPCDCEGRLAIDTTNCIIMVIENPCDTITSYEWQIQVDEGYQTIFEEFDNPIPDYTVNENGIYQLYIICDDGCHFTSNMVELNECPPDNCNSVLTVDQDTVLCTLTASVTNCPNPTFTWYYQNDGLWMEDSETGPVLNADMNTNYYVEVTGCPDCNDIPLSDIYNMPCGPDCNCNIGYVVNGCVITITSIACTYDELLWLNGAGGTVQTGGLVYTAPDNFPVTIKLIINGDCTIMEVVVPECPVICPDPEVFVVPDANCSLVANWSNCLSGQGIWSYDPDAAIGYCDDGTNYQPVTITPIEIDNGDGTGSSTITLDPTMIGCYRFELICGSECGNPEPYHIWWEDQCCAPGSIMIHDNNQPCLIEATSPPCQGSYHFIWTLNGVTLTEGDVDPATGPSTVPPITATLGGWYQLTVICDATECAYPSNLDYFFCAPPNCAATVTIAPDGCTLTAIPDNCIPTGYEWSYDDNGTWVFLSNDQTINGTDGVNYQVTLLGCDNCDYPQPSTTHVASCIDPCPCTHTLGIDSNCELFIASETGCSEQWISQWYYPDANDPNTLVLDMDATNDPTYIPLDNGVYQRCIVFLNDCGTVCETFQVVCLSDCDSNPTFSEVNCELLASWPYCGNYPEIEWGFIENSSPGECNGQSGIELNTIYAGIVGDPYYDPITQNNYSPLTPTAGPGCYYFQVQCEGVCIAEGYRDWWEPCCDPASISFNTSPTTYACAYQMNVESPSTNVWNTVDVVVDNKSVKFNSLAEIYDCYGNLSHSQVDNVVRPNFEASCNYVIDFDEGLMIEGFLIANLTPNTGAFIETITVESSTLGTFTLNIGTSSPFLSGVAGTVNPTHLLFNSSNTNNEIKDAYCIVIQNAINSTIGGAIQTVNFGLQVSAFNNGFIRVSFHAYDTPSINWIGLARSTASLVDNNNVTYNNIDYFIKGNTTNHITVPNPCGPTDFFYEYFGVNFSGVIDLQNCDYNDISVNAIQLSINAPPSQFFGASTCQDPALSISAILSISCNGSLSYVWTTTDGMILSGQGTSTITVTTNGTYNVQITCGECSYTESFTVSSLLSQQEQSGETYSGFMSSEEQTTNLKREHTDFKIYPNPTQSFFNIEIPVESSVSGKLRLTNTTGQLIYSRDVSYDKGTYIEKIDVAEYPPGIYFISLETTDENYGLKRVIVLK